MNYARGKSLDSLLRWAYSRPDGMCMGGIAWLANVIHCHFGAKAALMRGMYNLHCAGHEVGPGNTIDQVSIDGCIGDLTRLAAYACGASETCMHERAAVCSDERTRCCDCNEEV